MRSTEENGKLLLLNRFKVPDGPDLTESSPTYSHGTHVGRARPVCWALETTLAQPPRRGA